MIEIVIKGKAGNAWSQKSDSEEENYKDIIGEELKVFNDIDCQDEFTEYFGDDEELLLSKGVKSGYMSFKFEDNKLNVIVKYTSKEFLTEEELEILKEYTSGQISDGIGEGFEQQPCVYKNDTEYYISPWFRGQILETTQKEI